MRRCWVNFQCRGVLLIWIIVGQGPIALAIGAGGGCLDIFSLNYHFSFLSPSIWETARYRLKYCLKGPLNPEQPTKIPPFWGTEKFFQNDIIIHTLPRTRAIVDTQKFKNHLEGLQIITVSYISIPAIRLDFLPFFLENSHWDFYISVSSFFNAARVSHQCRAVVGWILKLQINSGFYFPDTCVLKRRKSFLYIRRQKQFRVQETSILPNISICDPVKKCETVNRNLRILVGCFGLNGPLRQYFSLYRAVSQREGERAEKRIDESKNVQTTPTTPTTSAVGPCPTVIQIVGRPGTESLPSTIAPPDHPRKLRNFDRILLPDIDTISSNTHISWLQYVINPIGWLVVLGLTALF